MDAISQGDLEQALDAQKTAGKNRKPLIATLIEMGKLEHDKAFKGLKKLIEMTIVEVELSDNYQAGVDWQRLSADQGLGSNGLSYTGALTAGDLRVPPFVSLNFNSVDDDGSRQKLRP